MPAMSQGNRSQNIPLKTNCLSDSELEEREIMLKIAANPQTPIDLLQQLAYSRDRLIRKTLVGNPNTPRDILFKLGAEFPDSLINNPVWDLLFLEDPTAIGDVPLIVQQYLLLQDDVPYYLMESIAQGGNRSLYLGLTRHPKTPLSILQKIVNSSHTCVQEAARLHINWTEPLNQSVQEIVIETLKQRISTASTRTTLIHLAKSGLIFDFLSLYLNENYRYFEERIDAKLWINALKNLQTQPRDGELTFNPKQAPTLEELLTELSEDRHPEICQAFSVNSNCVPSSFQSLFEEDLEDDHQNDLDEIEFEFQDFSPEVEAILDKIIKFCNFLIYNFAEWGRLLYRLVRHRLYLAQKIAKQPNSSASLLEHLAMSDDVLVQRNVAQHPNTPKSALKLLALFPDVEVRCLVAKHPNTRPFERLILAIDEAVKVRREIAKHPKSPVIALELLAMDPDVWTRVEVAQHPNTPVTCLEHLALDANFYVKTTAISNPNTPIDLLVNLISSKTFQVKFCSTIPSLFFRLFSGKLIETPEYRFRKGLVRNDYFPNFSPPRDIDGTNIGLVKSAINNPNISVGVLKELLCNCNLYAESGNNYRVVASHYLKHKPKSLPFVLKKLVEYSTDYFERLVALLHPQVTPSALAQNLWSLDWLERYCIAQHPNTPLYTLKELAKDGNRVVRVVAQENLKQRQSSASTASD